jgi:hypothetical protein
LRAGDDRRNNGGIESADPLEEVANLFVFEFQLGFVGDVLILAAATIAKVTASWTDSVRRWLNQTQEPGASKALFRFSDFGFDCFADQNEWDEDNKIFNSRDAFTTECNIGNGEGQVFANSGTHDSRLRMVRSGRKLIRDQ